MIRDQRVTAILPAAGIGRRMMTAGHPLAKQFILLGDRPILSHSLQTLDGCDAIDDIVIVCESSMIDYVATEIVEACRFTKIRRIVPGGKERQDSVYAGFQSCPDAEFVLVHDAVRPFVSRIRIHEVLEAAADHGAAILAVPAKDTIKSQDEQQFVERTMDRSVLWNVQTPQAFAYDILRQAFDQAIREQFYSTDESALVEAAGFRVKIVPGDYDNIKITSPEDLIIAEAILSRRGS